MSNLTRVLPRAHDELGLEVPFAEGFEAGEQLDAGLSLSEFGETPFAEAALASGTWSEASGEMPVSFEGEGFPSGLVLQTTSGATGRGEEHWDPHSTGLPLLATGPSTHSKLLSPHFTVKELVSSGGRAASVARISPALVRVLEAIRERAGKPIRITSAYRSWARNKQVYAARGQKPTASRHCSGQAADIKIPGMTGVEIARLAIDAAGTDLAIGIGRNYIHVDVRGTWTLWTYFPRRGAADLAAKADVQQHRERRLRGISRVPVSPPSLKPPARVPPPSGPSANGRLVVDKHPLLRSHRGTAPDLILRWNRVSGSGEIDVVVHFHGYSGQRGGMRLDRDKEPRSGLDFSDPAAPGSPGRDRPTLAILPRGNYFGGQSGSGYNFPALVRPGALQELIQDALLRLGRATSHSVRMGRLILTGHSGGGAPLSAILAHTDPDEVHVFDGLYGSGANIVRWAGRRIAREIATPGPLPPAMRILYRPGSKAAPGTQPHSEAVARDLNRSLHSSAAARLRPFFRVDRTSVPHDEIPRRFGWLLLADPAAELPGATTYISAGGSSAKTGGEVGEEPEASESWEGAPNDREESEREATSVTENQLLEADEALDSNEAAAAEASERWDSEALAWLDVEAPGPESEELEPPVSDVEAFEPEASEAGWSESISGEGLEGEELEPPESDVEAFEPEASEASWSESVPREGLEGEELEPPESDVEAFEPEASEAGWSESVSGEGPEGEELEPPEGFDTSEDAGRAQAETTEVPPEGEAFAADMTTLEALLENEAGVGTGIADRVKGVAAFVLGPTLRPGSSGPAVATLQRALASLGADIAVDGDFGRNTERAVRAFQSRSGLTADGVVEPRTKAAIAAALVRGGTSPVPRPSTSALCDAIARIAEQEYRRWHPATGNLRETDSAAVPVLQQYYGEALNQNVSAAELQNPAWQQQHPWSAVFVSWVMRKAGAGAGFAYSAAHQGYIRAARRNRLEGVSTSPFWAYRATEVAPQVGDLVCASRSNSGATYDNIADPQIRATHCDIVTEVRPGSLRVIGGNVRQNVDAKTIRTQPDGRLALDGNQARFFAIVRCRGAAGGQAPRPQPPAPPAPTPLPPTKPPRKKLTPHQFVAAYGAMAQASQAATGVPALVTLGQAALESGWGERAWRFNFFGIKAKASDPESTRQLLRTREVFPDRNRKFPEIISITPRPDGKFNYVVRDWFRAFPDAATAFNAHGEFLVRNKRYAKAFTVANDPYAFAAEVARAGYATDPSYERVLTSTMRRIEAAGRP